MRIKPTPAAFSSQENPAENSYREVELGESIYYVEAVTSENNPGDNLSALDSGKMIGAARIWTGFLNLAEGCNIYVTFTGIGIVTGADASGEWKHGRRLGKSKQRLSILTARVERHFQADGHGIL